ncbi:cyclin-domain-containing protein [Sporodiniella umbellata]|nr:cyclin-domain-containing protein [Sporodiniella umbellata]
MNPLSLLQVNDCEQLSQLCTAIVPCIWSLKRNQASKRQAAFKLFVHKVLQATQLSCTCILIALYYIKRLRIAYPVIHPSTGSEIRLFATALVLANKFLEDSTFTNKTWASVSGIPIKELNIMEKEFLSALDYNICISPTDFHAWADQCQHLWLPPPSPPKRALGYDDENMGYKKARSMCKPILSWSSSVSALTSSRIMKSTTYTPF